MERLPVQSAWWRMFALASLFLGLWMMLAEGGAAAIGLNWATAKGLYWLTALIGLLGYAYGFRLLSLAFWRVYAILFTLEITWRSMKVAWVLPARLAGWPDDVRHDTVTILLGLALLALPYIALLRYADLLAGGRTGNRPDYREIFA